MTPEDIILPLLRRVDLPRSVVDLLKLLLAREITHNFPTHGYAADKPPERVAVYYIEWLLWFFNGIPSFTDKDPSKFSAPLWQLKGMTYDEAYEKAHPGSRAAANQGRRRLRKDEHEITVRYNKFWDALLHFNVSFTIPESDRWEHCHILGRTGAGKTQLIQQLVLADLQTDAAVIVMTLKGSMIPTIASLKSIQHRLVYFSPKNPIPLNIFGLKGGENAVELINQMFAVVGDAQATARQTPMLNHSIRLLAKYPGATLRSLFELMLCKTLPEKYLPYLSQLSQSSQDFLRERFANQALATVKESLMWRIDSVLESPLVQQVFCQTETELDMHEVMEEGKVLLIDTDRETQGEEGSAFIGRFFIALIAIAAQQRKSKRPVYVYIDEAGAYMTPNIGLIMERTREARVGLTIAHQDLSQLGECAASVMTNTGTKFVGRCLDTDANRLSSAMCVEPERLEHQRRFNFHLTWPELHARSLQIRVTPGLMEKESRHPYQPSRPSERIEYLKAAEDQAKYTPDPGTNKW